MKERELRDARVYKFFLTFIHNKCELCAKDIKRPDYPGKERSKILTRVFFFFQLYLIEEDKPLSTCITSYQLCQPDVYIR